MVVASSLVSAASTAVGTSVEKALAWEKRWYGSYFGETCAKRAGIGKLPVRFTLENESRKIGSDCATGSAVVVPAQTFHAFVAQTGIFLSGQITPYTFATVSDGEETSDCKVRDDDLQRAIQRMKSSSYATLPAARSHDSSRTSEKLDSFIARSIVAYTRTRHLPAVQSVTIGEYHEGDPFVVAQVDRQPYVFIEVPGPDQVANQSFCGLVYEGQRFVGRSPLEGPSRDASISPERFELNGRIIRLRP